jgi:hypothetical protein
MKNLCLSQILTYLDGILVLYFPRYLKHNFSLIFTYGYYFISIKYLIYSGMKL